ncbi:MAG: STAS domain-containing protein [Planctomycetes bacterium]|nr:STAS domain-containing protein [Planctomycetota bacterium]
MNVQVTFTKKGDINIIELSGRFVGKEAEDVIKEVTNRLNTKDKAKVIIDLTNLEYIGSQGASALMFLSEKYSLRVVSPQSIVLNTLTLLKLEQIIGIFATVDKAVEDLKKS